MNSRETVLILAGSASVHTWRYLNGIAPYVDKILLISNHDVPAKYRPHNLTETLHVDFSITTWLHTPRQIGNWLAQHCPWLVHSAALSGPTQQTYPPNAPHTVLHVHQANSVAWHVWRATADMPLHRVLTCWGSDILLLPQRGRLWRRMVAWNLAQADWLTAGSLYLASKAQELLGTQDRHISMLHFGIDELPEPPPINGRPLRILSNRLHKPLYRIDAILRAWALIETDSAPWQLTIAGDGEQTDELKALARQLQLQRVEFTGFVDAATLTTLYRDSRIFISVPTSDSTSISLMEALGHGCLPVLSYLPANLEAVLDGINGLITMNTSPQALAATLRQALHLAQDAQRMEEIVGLNQRIVEQKALHSNSMRQFADIYKQLSHM